MTDDLSKAPDPSVPENETLHDIIRGVIREEFSAPMLMDPEHLSDFRFWLPSFMQFNRIQHGHSHRNDGDDPIPFPLSAIQPQVAWAQTFGGQAVSAHQSVAVKWDNFFTSDQTLFATAAAYTGTPVATNTPGDTNILCGRPGYTISMSDVKLTNGTYGRYAILNGSSYAPFKGVNMMNSLTTASAVSFGDLSMTDISFDQFLGPPTGSAFDSLRHVLVLNDDAVTHAVVDASLVVFWWPAVNFDSQVY